jgi:hypothetical protein
MSSYLEDHFPHVIVRLERAWGNRCAFNEVFNDLIFDSRGGRSGWPEEAWNELAWLNQLHKSIVQYEPEPIQEVELDDTLKWVS